MMSRPRTILLPIDIHIVNFYSIRTMGTIIVNGQIV